MNRPHHVIRRLAALAAAVVVLAGCATSVAGTPVRVGDAGTGSTTPTGGLPLPPVDPTAGGPTTTRANPPTLPTVPTEPAQTGVPDSAVGLKPGVQTANLPVKGDANTDGDNLAKDTLADVIDFYTALFPKDFGKPFSPPANYLSYDSNDKNASVCNHPLYQEVNAMYASPPCDTVLWDRGVLIPQQMKDVGLLSVPTILAHEMGHRVQYVLGFDTKKNTVLVAEQQADCYAGGYWRWVADGNSKYFNFNQGAGVAQALTSLINVRDPIGFDPNQQDGTGQGAHGDAFDRAFAFTLGFANGVKRCNEIDQKEVDARVSESPFYQIPNPKTAGNLPITDAVLADVTATVNDYFSQTSPGYKAPTLVSSAQGPAPACQGFTASAPAAYCPPTNTVSYDLAELQRIGTPTAGFKSFNGDFSAIITVVSRYALAAQAAGNSPVTGNNAGLRGLCYAGTWAAWMRNPQGPKKLKLAPADLDKAVYELINSPMPGSDANGATTTSIFDRVQAFNIGVTSPINTCFEFYSN